MVALEDSFGDERADVVRVAADESARVFEIGSADALRALVLAHPLEVTEQFRSVWFKSLGRDGRWWIPDWASVAREFDAVHLTVDAYLALAGSVVDLGVDSSDVATTIAGWGPDDVLWLGTSGLRIGDEVEEWRMTYSGLEWPQHQYTVASLPDGPYRVRAMHSGRERRELVLELDGDPVGVAWATGLPSADPDRGSAAGSVPVVGVFVQPEFRRRRVGGILLTELCDQLEADGVQAVATDVLDGDPERGLYTRLRFREDADAADGRWRLEFEAAS